MTSPFPATRDGVRAAATRIYEAFAAPRAGGTNRTENSLTPSQRNVLASVLASESTKGELSGEQQKTLRYTVALAVTDAGRPAEVAMAVADVAVVLAEMSVDDAKKVGGSVDVDAFAHDFGLTESLTQRARALGLTGVQLSSMARDYLRSRSDEPIQAFIEQRVQFAEVRRAMQQHSQGAQVK